jgi:hypothetical protein
MMRTILALVLALALALATTARADDLWLHNGSLMGVGPDRTVVYLEPRPGVIAAGVTPGTVLFQGDADNVHGTAFGFSYGCPPTRYPRPHRPAATRHHHPRRSRAGSGREDLRRP